jgi:hypothetical protein
MIGLLATYYIVAYLLIPGVLFRSLYSAFFPRVIKFQRTRAEEFTFASLASLLPFCMALALVWTVASWPFSTHGASSADRRDAYRTVMGAAISDKVYSEGRPPQSFWASSNQVMRRQARFLFWYYLFILIEAVICAWLTLNYGRWSTIAGVRGRLYRLTANKLLLPSITEWFVLLTPFTYPPEPRREVWVDVLTTIDILYKGHVADFFLDNEGQLSGIFLKYPRRFDRVRFLNDIAQGVAHPDTESYWRNIPSNNLFIPYDKIVNLNVRHLTEAEATALRASWLLIPDGLDVQVAQ